MKIFETFAGLGAQHKALTNLKKNKKIDDFEVVGISEWYINGIISYAKIHYKNEFDNILNSDVSLEEKISFLEQPHFVFSNDSKNPITNISKLNDKIIHELYAACKVSKNYGSITEITGEKLPEIDILTYSFPCQDLSNLGLKQGLQKGTRSGLLFEIERIIKELHVLNKLPKFLLMENVVTIYQKSNIETFTIYLEELKKIGYSSYCFSLNAKDYNLPQSRQRAFVISFLSKNPEIKHFEKDFFFYKSEKVVKNLGEFLKWDEKKSNPNFIEEEENCIPNRTISRIEFITGKQRENYSRPPCKKLEFETEYTSCLTTKQDRVPNSGIIMNEDWFRFLTPRECFLLMGFENEDFENVKTINKEHLYRLAGNSIGVNVLEVLFYYIFKEKFE